MKAAIELSHVNKKRRGKRILRDISLRVNEGAVCALIGPNGSGKSTLLRIALGLTGVTSGKVTLWGESDARGLAIRRRNVGYVPDRPGSFMHLSARDNIRVRCREWGISEERELARVLDLVGLSDADDSPVRTYSLGMQRRLDIATAMLGDPSLLVLDEPGNGLDPSGVEAIWSLIRRLGKECATTVLLSSHDLDELEMAATDIVCLSGGAVEGASTVADALARYGSLKSYYFEVLGKEV